MRLFLFALLLPVALQAHAVSISSGEFVINGAAAHYTLRVPLYETTHLTSPQTELLKQVTFSSGGAEAALQKSDCRAERQNDQYLCEADYTFARPVDKVSATCRLFAVLVPNHVHMLRVVSGDRAGQAAFDQSFPQATIELQPQSGLALQLDAAASGVRAALTQPGLWLVLCTLALGARTGREFSIFLACVLAGEILILVRPTDYLWKISPYFVEAALGLTCAYLAGEMIFFRHAGKRWVVVLLMAVWLGCFLKVNYGATGESGAAVFTGFLLAQTICLSLLYLALHFGRRSQWRERVRQPAAIALMTLGLGWFFWRWWS